VGVNKYRSDEETMVDVLDIDNTAVREQQIARLNDMRSSRDEPACRTALRRLTEAAGREDNLLAACIEAARARASVGEMSDALEESFGRHQAQTKLVSGVYASSYEGSDDFESIQTLVKEFAADHGRRPRMLVVKMGQDGHDRGAKVIATSFADLGFDVDVGPLFQTPAEVAQDAVDNDVHIVGVSSQAAGHKTLVPDLINELEVRDAAHVVVVCGGVIPPQDYDFLTEAGVAAIFGPGTNIIEAAETVLSVAAGSNG
jgi:methylmalonyl-CoA mutase